MSAQNCIVIVGTPALEREQLRSALAQLSADLIFADGASKLPALDFAPDLIMLHSALPEPASFAICQQLRADPATASVALLLLLPAADHALRLRGFAAGADAVVGWPADPAELQAQVRALIRTQRRLANERARSAWMLEHTADGYLTCDQHGAISAINAGARIYLDAPASTELGSFPALAARQYLLEPELDWANWRDLDSTAARYLVRPASEHTNMLVLQVELLPAASDTEPRYHMHLRDVTGDFMEQSAVWSFQSLVRHKLATSVSHLVGSLWLLENMLREQKDAKQVSLMTIATRGAKNLQADINDVCQYIDTSDSHGYDHDLCALAELPAIIAAVGAALEHVTITLDQVGALDQAPTLAIARPAISSILRELFENAQKFHPQRTPSIVVTLRSSKKALDISISDDGYGLPAEQLALIWRPYYQSERNFTGQVPGMGLGLPIVAALIWRSGGSCRVTRRADAPGTVVELRIPFAK